MLAEGACKSEIAKVLDRSYYAITVRASRLGLSQKRHSLAFWESMFSKPHTIGELASTLGVTQTAVLAAKKRLRKAGRKPPRAVGHRWGRRDKKGQQNGASLSEADGS